MRQLRIIFLFLLLLSSVRILAAGSDSLRRQEADELYRLIRYYYSKNTDSMRYFIQKAEPVFLEVGRIEDLFRVKGWNIYTMTSRREDDGVLREVNALKALSKELNFPEGADMANQALADFYIETGFMSEGIALYEEVLQGMEERDTPLPKRIYIIRQILNKGRTVETRKRYLEKLKAYIDYCDGNGITELNEEMSVNYLKYLYHRSYAVQGLEMNDAKLAHSHLILTKRCVEEANLVRETQTVMNLELDYSIFIKDYDRALTFVDTLLSIVSSEKKNTQILLMLAKKADILLQKGEGVKSAKTYQIYTHLKDSLMSAEFYADLAMLRNQHDVDKLELANKKMELDASHLRANLLTMGGGLAILMIICCFLGYISYSRHRYGLRLERAKEKAEEADRLKSAFLANMNHEIRTPLNAIVGFSQVLVDEEDRETRLEFSNIIQSNNELLQRLIGDVLDLSKIESNSMPLIYKELDIRLLMKEIYSMILLRMPSGIELRLNDCEALVMEADKNRLTQILTNLLTNSIKHTEKGFIRFGYKRTAASVEFFVEDSGEGIPRDKIDSIFSRFVQLDSWSKGVGLGLAICRGLVEQMGGKIWVTSELGKGSIFYVTLPLIRPNAGS